MDQLLDRYNIKAINFNEFFVYKCEPELLQDLENYNLTGEKLSNPDVKRLFYHHIILKICQNIIDNGQSPIYVFHESFLFQSIFEEYYSPEEILKYLKKIIVRISTLLPIKIFIESVDSSWGARSDTGALYMYVNHLRTLNDSFKNKAYTFEKIKRFTKKYGLTFLNQDYFNEIKTKQILIQ